MILNAIAEKLKRQSRDDFKGRHFETWLIMQAVTWYLRYPLSYRDLESMFLERGFEFDHSTVNRKHPTGTALRGVWWLIMLLVYEGAWLWLWMLVVAAL